MLTATVAPSTYLVVDELCERLSISRGACIDRAIDMLKNHIDSVDFEEDD